MPSHIEDEVELHSRTEEIGGAKRSILAAARQFGFGELEVSAINLALEEALTNAICHGNRGDPRKLVHIAYRVDARELRLTVRDQGDGFDVRRLPDPTLPAHQSRPSGRGVLLMYACMDSVSYNDTGNAVTLVKKSAWRQ